MPLQFNLLSSAGIPEDLGDDWDRLAASRPLESRAWRETWWRVFGTGKQLRIAVARNDGRVVGLAPCYSTTAGWLGPKLHWLGDGRVCTDYQRYLLDDDLPIKLQTAVIDGLTDALVDGARRKGPAELWTIDGLRPDDSQNIVLEAALRRRGFKLHSESLESSWVLTLPENWVAFKANAHRSLRRKIAKAERRAEQSDIAFRTADTPEQIAAAWSEFVRLHQLRFRNQPGGGCFRDAQFSAFLPEAVSRLAADHGARLVWCEVAGRAVAAQLYLLGGRTASMYQSGFDPDYASLEPGYLLYTRVVHNLIAEGYASLDFLRGDEPYKAAWGATRVPLARLIAVPPRPWSQFRHQTYQLARTLRRAAKIAWSSPSADAETHTAAEPTVN